LREGGGEENGKRGRVEKGLGGEGEGG